MKNRWFENKNVSTANKIVILQNIFATVSKAPPFDLAYFASPSKTFRAYIFSDKKSAILELNLAKFVQMFSDSSET